jgi:FMN phosphatase YigB (HAD superfamily)
VSPSLVLLDVAGTLLVKPGIARAFVDAVAPVASLDESLVARRHKLVSEFTAFPGRPDRAFYDRFNAEVLRALGVPAEPGLVADVFERCRALPWLPAPGVEALAALDARLGVVSNWGDGLDNLLAPLGLPLVVVVTSAQVGLVKPDLAIFRLALDRVDVVPAEAVYVGDSVRLDVEPARAAGMCSVLVDPLGLFAAHPGCRVSSLDEVPGTLSALR